MNTTDISRSPILNVENIFIGKKVSKKYIAILIYKFLLCCIFYRTHFIVFYCKLGDFYILPQHLSFANSFCHCKSSYRSGLLTHDFSPFTVCCHCYIGLPNKPFACVNTVILKIEEYLISNSNK